MVEQADSEDFDHWVKGDASNIVEETLHQAPVVTKQWFHNGCGPQKVHTALRQRVVRANIRDEVLRERQRGEPHGSWE